MDIALKQRLLGAAVLTSLGVLVIPMLLDTQRQDLVDPVSVEPATELRFTYSSLPAEPIDTGVTAKPEAEPQTPSFQTREQWFVQVGSFQNPDNTKRVHKLLHNAGYPVEVVPDAEGTDRETQRVWVGPYLSQAQADQALEGILAKPSLTPAHQGWVVKRP